MALAIHSRFPPAFQAAAQALLLVAHCGGQLPPAAPLPGAASRRQRRIPSYRRDGLAAARGLGSLPQGVLLHMLGHAAWPLSAWMEA